MSTPASQSRISLSRASGLRLPLLLMSLSLGNMLATERAGWGQEVAAPPAEKSSVRPGINSNFLNPELDVKEYIERFEIESRETYAAREEVVQAMKLSPGERIVDIGAGTGFYALEFADAVGDDGWVFAAEIAPRFVEHLGSVADSRGGTNITPILSGESDIRLPANTVDVAFSSDVYHHFEYPQLTLRSILRALRPGGRMYVIDFERIPGVSREWTLEHVRAGKEIVRQEIESAGFEYVGEQKIAGFRENYFLEFRKPKQAKSSKSSRL